LVDFGEALVELLHQLGHRRILAACLARAPAQDIEPARGSHEVLASLGEAVLPLLNDRPAPGPIGMIGHPWYWQGIVSDHLFPHLADPNGRSAVTVGVDTLSYTAMADACQRHGRSLEARGVRPGDRVLVRTTPSIGTVIELVGNAVYGAVSVPLNPKLGTRELAHVTSDSQRGELVGDDPSLLVYTSGTTGAPKGAVITKRNIAANLDALANAWALSDADTIVHALPLFHVHGLVLGLFGALRAGAHLRWIDRFSPPAVADALTAGGTVLFAVPTMYRRLVEAAERDAGVAAALRRARLLVSGSAGLPVREHQRMQRVVGCPVYERYGLTETLINCAVRADGPPRPGYVGPPLAGVELRLVDDDGKPLEARDDVTIGEVAVRGDHVFAGYHANARATREVLDDDGWFRTGDLATIAPDGAVRLHGRRATDLIKTGGYKVGAGEVETCLLEVEGVREVAVVGLDDDDLGQRIVAFIVGDDDGAGDALIDHVASELSPHKRPREVRFVNDLPRNAMGKVQKKRLLAGD